MATNYQLYDKFVYPTLKRILLADRKDSSRKSRVAEIFVGMNALMGIPVKEQDLPGVWEDWLRLREARRTKPVPALERVYAPAQAKAESLTRKQAVQVLESFLRIADAIMKRQRTRP